MLDQLMNSIGGEVANSIAEKAGISTDQAKQALPIAQESLQSTIMDKVSGGGLDDVLGMFNSAGGGLENNGLFGSIKQKMMQGVMQKMGLPAPVAGLVAGSGLGSIIGKIAGKAGGAGNVTQDGLMGLIGGGDGIKGMLGNMAKDKLGDIAKDKLGGIFG